MGIGTIASASAQVTIGHYNFPLNSPDHLFVVGGGTGVATSNRGNLLEVYGGIGSTYKAVKIDVGNTFTQTSAPPAGFNVYGNSTFRGNITASLGSNIILNDDSLNLNATSSFIILDKDSLTLDPSQDFNKLVINRFGINFEESNKSTSPGTKYLWTDSSDRLFYGSGAIILNGGNTLGGAMTIGTNDTNNLQLETGGTTRVFISSSGNVGIGTSNPTEKLYIDGSLTVTGRITAEEFHTEFVSASIIYQSGSTQFGNSLDDTHIFTGSLRVNGSITGSLFGTSSWAVNALSASYFSGQNFATFTQSVASTTWTFNHNLSFRTPVITIYNSGYEVVIPDSITGTSDNQSVITFSTAQSGYATATVGSILPTNANALMIAYAIVL